MTKEADALIGKEIGHCRIERKLGSGGMGTVYLAHHTGLKKPVAIKVLSRELSTNVEFIERFVREARLAARLEHPNVVQVFDVGSEQGTHYIAMQYVEGRSLDRILKERGKFTPGESVSIAKRVAVALAAAHKLGIVHRDIKPANILLSKDGIIKVADFGLAKDTESHGTLSGTGQIVGTPYYMSPEQAQGLPVDARSDLYSLGATLYHLVTGRRPFEAPTPMSIVIKHVSEEPKSPRDIDPTIPEGLCAVLLRLLAKKPEARQRGAEELIREFDALRSGPPSTVTPPGPRKSVRQAAMIALPIAGILIVGIVVGLILGRSEPQPAVPPSSGIPPTSRAGSSVATDPRAREENSAPKPPVNPGGKPGASPTDVPAEKPTAKTDDVRQKLLGRVKDFQERRLMEDLLGRIDDFLKAFQKKDFKSIRGMLDRLSFGEPTDAQLAEAFGKISSPDVSLEKWEVQDVDLRLRGLVGRTTATCQMTYTVKIPKGEVTLTDQPIHWVRKVDGWVVTRPVKSAGDK